MAESIPVVFTNAENRQLFGILHLPSEQDRQKVGIILLSPGVKMRVAPHRLYNDMAESFLSEGYAVLRFDFWGLGDSEGEIDDRLLAEFYGKVQVGLYKSDTVAAMDWFANEYGISEFLLAGLCGGAITGLLTAAEDTRVKGLIGLGVPVILDNAEIDANQYVTVGQLRSLRRGYLQRLLSWKSWLRLLTFRTDFSLLFRSLMSASKPKPKKTTDKPATTNIPDNFNPLFPDALFKMTHQGRPVCFIFSGADRLHYEYEEKFVARYKAEIDGCEGNLETHLIENANHILSSPEHKAEMLQIVQNWLRKYFKK